MITVQAHAKINWALNITGLRADGYHLLDMVMQRISLCDDLRLEPAEDIVLTVDGTVPADMERNLVTRAARALNAYAGTAHGARIDLTKRIPARAGLGGGSADCAATLRALNQMWKLGLSDEALLAIGARLGADVPFCLTGGLARVQGIGERVTPVSPAPEIPLVLVTPGGGLSTAEVFTLWDRGHYPAVALDAQGLAEAVSRRNLDAIDRLCQNALTAPAVALMPEIGALIDDMRRMGARAAFMTGSGSTVVGAFDTPAAAEYAAKKLPGALTARTIGDQ